MSTNIRVDVALAGLLQRLKAQQNAQRLAFLQKRENLTFEQQLAEALKQQLPTQLLPQQKREPRKEELAAFRTPPPGGDPEFSYCWIGSNSVDGPREPTYLHCGDGSVRVALPFQNVFVTEERLTGQDPSVDYKYPDPLDTTTDIVNDGTYTWSVGAVDPATGISYAGFFGPSGTSPNAPYSVRSRTYSLLVAFPAGEGRAVVVAVERRIGHQTSFVEQTTISSGVGVLSEYSQRSYYETVSAAYRVDETSINEIDGGTLVDYMLRHLPTYSLYPRLYIGALGGSEIATAEIQVIDAELGTQLPGFPTINPGLTYLTQYRTINYGHDSGSLLRGYGPAVFQTITKDWNTFDLAELDYDQIDSILNTTRCRHIAKAVPPEENGGNYEVDLWSRPFTLAPNSGTLDPSAYRAANNRIEMTPWNTPASMDGLYGFGGIQRVVASDWGDPDYCKQRLAAFGVSV